MHHDAVDNERAGDPWTWSFFEDCPVALWSINPSGQLAWMQELRQQGVTDIRAYLSEHPDEMALILRRVQFVDINAATVALFETGDKASFLEGIERIFLPEGYEAIVEGIAALWNGQRRFRIRGRATTLQGVSIDFMMEGSLCDGPNECDHPHMIVALLDFTEAARAEQRLVESQAHLASIFRAAPTGIGLISNRLIIDVNDRVSVMTGYSREELIGSSARMLYPSEEEFEYVGRVKYAEVREKGTGSIETRWQCKDGTIIDVLLSSTPLDASHPNLNVTFSALDITDRKGAERALAEGQARYQAIFEGTPDAIFLADAETGIILDANTAASSLLQRPRHEVIGMHQTQLHPLQTEAYAREIFRKHASSEKRLDPLEALVLRADGTEVPVEIVGEIIELDGRTVVHGVFRDVTQRKAAERKLLLTQFAVDRTGDAVFWMDSNANFVYVNDSACRSLGYTREELLTMTVYDIDPDFSPEAWRAAWECIVRDGHISQESRHRTKRGELFPVEISANYMEFEGRQYDCAFARDITHRKAAEAELQYRLAFENIIASVSSQMINIEPHEVDAAINDALAKIGTFTGIDRSYMFLFNTDATRMSNTHEWCADGIEPAIHRVLDVPIDSFYVTRELLSKGRILHVPRVADLGSEADFDKREFEAQGIQSIINVPIACGEKSIGFLGFDSVRSERTWSDDEISLLRTVGEIFANTIERKRTQEQLRKAKDFSENIIETVNAIVLMLERDGRITVFNRFAEHLTGYGKQDVIGQNWYDIFILPGKRQAMFEIHKRVLAEDPAVATVENEIVLRDGEKRLIRWSNRAMRDNDGLVVGTISVGIDITEQRLAEQRIRESEERYRDLFESANDVIMMMDGKGNILAINPLAETLTGYSHQELLAKNIFDDLMLPEDRQNMLNVFQGLLHGGSHVYEVRWRTRDGRIIQFEGSSSAQMGPNGRFANTRCILRDVTERRRSEEREKLANERLRLSVENMLDGYIMHEAIFDETGRMFDYKCIQMNSAAEQIIAAPRDSIIGHTALELFPFIVEQGLMDKFADVMATGNPTYVEDFHYKYANIDRNFDISCFRLDGKHFVCIFRDMTERRRAAEALRNSEARYRLVVESAEQPIFIVNRNGVFEFMNTASARQLGGSVDELTGKTTWDFFPRSIADSQMVEIAQALKSGRLHTIERKSVVRGQTRWFYTRIQPLLDEFGRYERALVVLTDITDSKMAEQQIREHRAELAHVWRVNTIGEMASGLAHELNQPLCAILNYSDASLRLIQNDGADTDKLMRAIEQIGNQAERAGQIIRRIRSLAGKREPHRSFININDIIHEVIEMVRAEGIQENIEIDLQLAEDLPRTVGDQIEVEEVALNLTRNAFDAMAAVEPHQRKLTVQTFENTENEIEVRVTDSGKGLSQDMIQRVFDPFYTTKAKGMGIGLSLSRTIIEAHGGRLWAEPAPEQGMSFLFTIPVTTEEPSLKFPSH